MACLATWKYLCSKQPCLLECWPFLLLVISGHSTICRVCACACIRVCCTTPLQTWIRIHIYMHIQVLIRAHISTHRNTNINTHKHAYNQYTYTRTNVHAYVYIFLATISNTKENKSKGQHLLWPHQTVHCLGIQVVSVKNRKQIRYLAFFQSEIFISIKILEEVSLKISELKNVQKR